MKCKLEKLKIKLVEVMKVVRRPSLSKDLTNENSSLKKEIDELKNENTKLIKSIENVKKELYYYSELENDLLTQKERISDTVNKILEQVLKANLTFDKERYERLKFLDTDGWCIYRASQEILKIDIYKEFVVEDSMGRFVESDGHDLIVYMEMVAFGDRTYKIIGEFYEVLDTYSIDYNSNAYQKYLKRLYPLTFQKMIDRLYVEDVSVKLKFILQNMDSLVGIRV